MQQIILNVKIISLCLKSKPKAIICIKKEFNSRRIYLGNQHGRSFFVLYQQLDCHDVIWEDSVKANNDRIH